MLKMKKSIKIILTLLIVSLVLPINKGVIKATETNNVAKVTGVNLSADMNGKSVVETSFKLNQKQARLDYFKELENVRREAWNNNLPFNGKPLQNYLREKGINSADEYVAHVKWDTSLEKLAIQRAIETDVHGEIEHKRADNDSPFSAKIGEQGFNGENIAWGFDSNEPFGAVYQQWYKGEVDALKASNGRRNPDNGHLHTLLNPEYYYHAFAGIIGNGVLYEGSVLPAIGLGVYSQRNEILNPDEGGTNLTGTFKGEVAVLSKKVEKNTRTGRREIPQPEDIVKKDKNLYVDEERIETEGRKGEEEVTITSGEYTLKNNKKLTIKEEVSEPREITPAVATVKFVGTATKDIVREEIPFDTERVEDEDMLISEPEKTVKEGVLGVLEKVFKVVYNEDGTVESRTQVGEASVTKEAENKIVHFGVKEESERVEREEIPFDTKYESDENMEKGSQRVHQEGMNGTKDVTYKITTVKGVEKNKEKLSEDIITEPTDKIVYVGGLEKKIEKVEKVIEKNTVYQDVDTMYIGEEKEIAPGMDGLEVSNYEVTYVNDVEKSRNLLNVEKTDAIDRIVQRGTLKRPVEFLDMQNIFTLGSNEIVSFRISPDTEQFNEVFVDGMKLDANSFDIESGSTIIKLKKGYLNTLSVGKHSIRVNFTEGAKFESGEVESEFIVKNADKPSSQNNTNSKNKNVKSSYRSSVDTGDNRGVLLIFMVCIASLVSMFVLRTRKNKK